MDKKGVQGGVVKTINDLAKELVARFANAPAGERQNAEYKAMVMCRFALCVNTELQSKTGHKDDQNHRLCRDLGDEPFEINDPGFRCLDLENTMLERPSGDFTSCYFLIFSKDGVVVKCKQDLIPQQKSYEDAVVFLVLWLRNQVFLVETAHLTFASLRENMFFERLEALTYSLFFSGVAVSAQELQAKYNLNYDLESLLWTIGDEKIELCVRTYNVLRVNGREPSLAELVSRPKSFHPKGLGKVSRRDLYAQLAKLHLHMGMVFPPEVVDWLKANGITLNQP